MELGLTEAPCWDVPLRSYCKYFSNAKFPERHDENPQNSDSTAEVGKSN